MQVGTDEGPVRRRLLTSPTSPGTERSPFSIAACLIPTARVSVYASIRSHRWVTVEVAVRRSGSVTGDSFPNDETDVPTVSCTRCDREWKLDDEFDDLAPGGHAIEQFALDHERHTGHFPDDVTPWIVRCRRCPDGEQFLSERPARRWAETHARHTRHAVRIEGPAGADDIVCAEDVENRS